ncbi:G-protein coupled receptor GRL101-like [Amphiura filiformis]|uniref:G-protein coupled receptor GRL101-like n=1 Tax=Amphiura filiformis TaxID=82378 RepID=UPI003B222E0B
MQQVCDGNYHCPGKDDEIQCDEKRCPISCVCGYRSYDKNDGLSQSILEISCPKDWTMLLNELPQITESLTLSGNNLSSLEPATFKTFNHMEILSLAGNMLTNIRVHTFAGLSNLLWLDLSHNKIQYLEMSEDQVQPILDGNDTNKDVSTSFSGLQSLQTLDLSQNKMVVLTSHIFHELPQLKELFLFDVPLLNLEADVFYGLTELRTLVLVRSNTDIADLDVDTNGFRGLYALKSVYVDDHAMCCYFNQLKECTTLEPQPPLFNCGSLMQNSLLRISMWFLGFSAIFGNVIVVLLRATETSKTATHAKQRLFICSLALSDSLMGVYMIILASADSYYGDEYFRKSDQWRTGPICKLAGFLGLLASEASVFFITLISVDRYLSVVFPFSQIKLRSKSSKISIAVLWMLAFVVALLPVLFAGPDSDFYDLSDVCIGLPLITRPASFKIESSGIGNQLAFDLPVAKDSQPAWYFSIAIFLGLNLVCFMAILMCYIFILISALRSGKQAGRKESTKYEIKLAVKMAAIVGTDFLCWFPVIMMGILSQTGAVVIPLDAYVWSVVFILPVNSSLNPYLYTLATVFSERNSLARKSTSGMNMTISSKVITGSVVSSGVDRKISESNMN